MLSKAAGKLRRTELAAAASGAEATIASGLCLGLDSLLKKLQTAKENHPYLTLV